MIVKRYVVDSMPEAMDKIKVELGKDAVILNTKQVKTGGWLGMFRKQQVEVIAAVEAKEETTVQQRAPLRQAAKKEPIVRPASNHFVHRAYQQTNEPIKPDNTTAPSAVTLMERAPEAPSVTKKEPGAQRPFITNEPKSFELEEKQPLSIVASSQGKQATVAERLEQTATDAPITTSNENRIQANSASSSTITPEKNAGIQEYQDMLGELRDMREMFQKLLFSKKGEEQLPAALAKWRDRLVKNEVKEEIVASLLQDVMKETSDMSTLSKEETDRLMRTTIYRRVEKAVAIGSKIDSNTRYLFFFGPTGVGKTTTIAKLAAWHMLQEKRKVGFITADTYRIAAVEQLKTYANILNVPLEVVFSPAEMEQALERLSTCDLVFIDTAGRNYRNDEYVDRMRDLLQWPEQSEHLLVMSLTSKYKDMETIIKKFRDVPISSVILTKADETTQYGSILGLIEEHNMKLSYLATGQNVPDDIEAVTVTKITNLIAGEEGHE
ncbi:flagellar biosynthesis protein FlhF [Brevibacillus daliensis]|uniref:flagellar biosynthesis protein FlhF n=1 Tax=Brevibacillus daliensis TaxID=2892995 RepID=UPI001E54B4C4|nr:flagellar biosynthesis protein FlhF [Brevibacillus daliensis]